MGKPGEHAEQPGGTDPEHALIPIRVLSDKFEWQVTHEHAAKCYQLERILVSVSGPTPWSPIQTTYFCCHLMLKHSYPLCLNRNIFPNVFWRSIMTKKSQAQK